LFDNQSVYRKLLDDILAYDGDDLFGHVLAPWTNNADTEKAWLTSVASYSEEAWPQATTEDLCRLYALSVVNDTLLMAFQKGDLDAALPELRGQLTLDRYAQFMQSCGCSITDRSDFHPFYHEIVEVRPAADPDAAIELQDCVWPCLMLGAMMFSRAGCVVAGGRAHIDKDVAENSTLYWAHRRADRPRADLSDGWGNNSKWRTNFRRDYRVSDTHCYNVDGSEEVDASERLAQEDDRNGLSPDERIELLTHRCFISVAKPHDDLWPYDYTLKRSG